MAENDIEALAVERMREIYISGHSEGWTGNQMRRDVQHVDAEKGWELYVQNGALEKTITALRSTTAPTDSAAKDAEIARAADLMKAIQHSVQMAMVPGNDWRRELRLIQGLTEAALANRGEAGALAKERAE